MTKQPLFSAMTTDFDADIKNFKEILNELELRTHTKNGYKFRCQDGCRLVVFRDLLGTGICKKDN